jgi:aspartate/methionine/tyrosine aminotransferase
MKKFQPFVMERMMSRFEKDVDYNLSESGVHPILLRELLAGDSLMLEKLLDTDLNYPHANGIPLLRQNISRMYDGAKPDNVLVTVGAIEAKYIILQTLLSEKDEIIVMLPNYMQIWGIAKNHGYHLKTFRLIEERNWSPDLDELESLLTPKTKLIAVCNPDNPTGRILTEKEMDGIISCAGKVNAWILADEVYRGATRVSDEENPSFFGRYDKVIAVGSMSKAYGLPGLRIGWAVGPAHTIEDIWSRHEYVAISATMLSNKLAAFALSPEVRPGLLQRARGYIRRGFPILQQWLNRHKNLFEVKPPDAAAIAFVRYHFDMNSTEFVERLCQEKSVLIVPGDHFGMDRFLRISFGLPEDYLIPALDRIHELIMEVQHH